MAITNPDSSSLIFPILAMSSSINKPLFLNADATFLGLNDVFRVGRVSAKTSTSKSPLRRKSEACLEINMPLIASATLATVSDD